MFNSSELTTASLLRTLRDLTARDLTQTGPAYLDRIVHEFSRLDASLEQMTSTERHG